MPKEKIIGVSQKAFLFRADGRFLTMRRTKTAPSNPLRWDLPGGDIEFGEDPLAAIKREIKEEAGLATGELRPFAVVGRIYRGNEYWVTVAYTTKVAKGRLKISWEHDLHQWVTIDEFLKLRLPVKIRRFAKTLKSLNRNSL